MFRRPMTTIKVERYNILVFGGCKLGTTLAMDQAGAGQCVPVVTAGMIGASCINIACILTRALVQSAQLVDLAHVVPRLA